MRLNIFLALCYVCFVLFHLVRKARVYHLRRAEKPTEPPQRYRLVRKKPKTDLHVEQGKDEALVGAWVRVPRDAVNMAQINADLTLRNPPYWLAHENDEDTTGLEPFVYLFREDGDFILVPRHYDLEPTRDLEVRRLPWTSPDVGTYLCQYKPRNDMQVAVLKAFKGSQDGILQLSCGSGKTASAMMIASQGSKFPMLVVVHTSELMEQWRRELCKAYNITPDDIGLVQGPNCDYKGKKVALAMLKSLSLKSYPQEFYDYWRFIVCDEAHNLAAYTYGDVICRFPGQRLALTATPERVDGMQKVFQIHAGKVRFRHTEQPLDSEFVFVHTGLRFDSPAMRNPMRRMAMVLSKVSRSEERGHLISSHLAACAREGRRVIVLGDRVETLKTLCKAYPGTDKSLLVGAMKKPERAEALKRQAIFATSGLAKEGLDVPSLDTLFITIPFSSAGRLEQSVGRILREYEGKKPPRTYIFVDNNPMIQRFASNMRSWAESKNYKISNIFPDRDIAA